MAHYEHIEKRIRHLGVRFGICEIEFDWWECRLNELEP